MGKRKPARFSAAKAVKANARERVGQPKPSRVLADKPRTGRRSNTSPRSTICSVQVSDPRRRPILFLARITLALSSKLLEASS